MIKNQLIKKHFDRSSILTIKNHEYRKILSSLFTWLIDADGVKNDITTKYLKIETGVARIICRDNHAVLCGMEELEFLITKLTKLDFIPLKKDKDVISKNQIVANLKGEASEILAYERTILNILQRLSGIATQTNTFIKGSMNMCYIAATRKTPWMWLDKKAVAVGGGLTHRLNLSDGILIKDNHLSLNPKSEIRNPKLLVEIEVESEKQALETIKTFQPNALMLDNFTPNQAKKTIENLKKQFDLSKIIIEASGGIDEENIADWIKTGVDILSLGSLTHSAKAANFSLEIS